jgi:hypothetical protein
MNAVPYAFSLARKRGFGHLGCANLIASKDMIKALRSTGVIERGQLFLAGCNFEVLAAISGGWSRCNAGSHVGVQPVLRCGFVP